MEKYFIDQSGKKWEMPLPSFFKGWGKIVVDGNEEGELIVILTPPFVAECVTRQNTHKRTFETFEEAYGWIYTPTSQKGAHLDTTIRKYINGVSQPLNRMEKDQSEKINPNLNRSHGSSGRMGEGWDGEDRNFF